MYTGLLYSIPLAAVAAASAFGWMLAYLRGPDTVAEYIQAYAGTDARMIMLLLVLLFIIVGDFVDAVPAIIIFMPIIIKLTELGDINSVHMGVVIITTLVFGLITPPYGLSLLIGAKFVGVPFYKAMLRSFPLYIVFLHHHRFHRAVPRGGAVSAEDGCCRSRSAASRTRAASATSARARRTAGLKPDHRCRARPPHASRQIGLLQARRPLSSATVMRT